MSLGTNLATRVTSLMLIGFILIQLFLLALFALPFRGSPDRPYNLPSPDRLAAIVAVVEAVPPQRQQALVDAFSGALYTVQLVPMSDRAPPSAAADLQTLQAVYAAALPGHDVRIEGMAGRLGRLIRNRPGPLRFLSPIRIEVALSTGETLVIDRRLSPTMRDYLRQRALLGLVGGLAVLGALAYAVRQTTRPLVRMSEGVRRFATTLDAPDLPVEGSQEVRDLSIAFNDMKTRIGGLIEERTRILAAIAHDTRTYLTRLRLRAEFIDDSEQRTKAVADLDEMSLLLDDTLLFARAEGGRQLHPERLNVVAELRTIVAERVDMDQPVTLDADGAAEMLVDRLAFRRMIANLIDNGIRYGSSVTVQMTATDAVRITVSDNGPGVPSDMLERLGQPYTRLDPSRDRASGGAGLGLAIVRALAEQSGAKLRLENSKPHGLSATLIFVWAS